jgi:hypothetical protein
MSETLTVPTRPRMQAPASAVAATSGAVFDEAVALTKALKLPHIRRAMTEVIPTAKAQRWDPAEVVRALLAEEAASRAASNLRTPARPVPHRQDLPHLERGCLLDPDPVRAAHPRVDRAPGESLCVRALWYRQEPLHRSARLAAIDAGMTVAWFTIEDLGGLVRRHRVDDSVSKAFARLTRTGLVIVDDIGLLPSPPTPPKVSTDL